MVLVKFIQELGHDGGPVQGCPGVDIEPPAIFRHHRHFAVIEVNDLTVLPAQGSFLLFQIFRIYGYFSLFPAQNEKFSVKVEILCQFPCYLLRNIVTFAA